MQFTQEQINWVHAQVQAGVPQDVAVNQLVQFLQNSGQAVQQPANTVQEQAVQQGTVVQGAQGAQVAVQAVAGAVDMNTLMSIANEAAEDEDHAAILSGKPPRAGLAFLRVKGYIEIGVHQGKNTMYSPKEYAITIFELNHPDHLVEREGVKVPDEIMVRMPKSHSNNSKFPKYFKALQRALGNHPQTGQQITHLSQALGMGCLGEIFHKVDNDKLYANLDQDESWSFKSSTYQDPATGQWQQVNIPPLYSAPMLFLLDSPTVNRNPAHVKAMWDSIYIPGTRESKDAAGNVKVTSRNYYQEMIAKSLHWGASETKRILDSLGCTTTFGATNAAQPNNQVAGMHIPANVAAGNGHAAAPAMSPALGQSTVPQHQPAQLYPNNGNAAGAGTAPSGMPNFNIPAQSPVGNTGIPSTVAQTPALGQPVQQVASAPVNTVPAVGGVPVDNGLSGVSQAVMQPSATPMSAADFMKQFPQQ